MTKLVVDADAAHRSGALLAEQTTHSLAQTADDAVLLAGDDPAAGLGGLEHQLLVQGLDGGHVDDLGGDAHARQGLSGGQRLRHHQTVGDDGHVRSLMQHLALADLEGIGCLVMEHGHTGPAEAHVDGTHVLVGRPDHSPGLHVISGGHHHHAGDGTHEGKILAALVGGAVLAHGDAAVGGADLHIQMGIANGIAHLLKGPARREHGEAGGKGHKPHGGGTGGSGDHVALGDAAVEMALRERLFEGAGLGGTRQIRVEHDEVRVLRAQLLEGVAVALPGGDLLHVCHVTFPPLLPAERKARSWRSQIPRRWAPCHASRPGFP